MVPEGFRSHEAADGLKMFLFFNVFVCGLIVVVFLGLAMELFYSKIDDLYFQVFCIVPAMIVFSALTAAVCVLLFGS